MTKRQKCSRCNEASIPGLISGHGHCQYHWDERVWGKKWADKVHGRQSCKLTPPQIQLLREYAQASRHEGLGSFAATFRVLARLGLVAQVATDSRQFPLYEITCAGREVLAASDKETA